MLLHQAAQAGDVERLRALLAQGEPVDQRDNSGDTPLMVAARVGHEDSFLWLIRSGADPRAVQNAKRQFDNSGLARLARDVTNSFYINVGPTAEDNNENTVDVHDINASFEVHGGANIDTLIAGYGPLTIFHGYASPDVLVNNFTGRSDEVRYYGGADIDTILVQGLVGDDTFDIDFTI